MADKYVQVGVLLEIGDVKKSNQDSVLHKVDHINNCHAGLFVIADGMGGLSFGEEISNLAVTYFNRWWDEILRPYLGSSSFNFNAIDTMLEKAIVEINGQAISFSKQMNQKAGSTLSLLLVIGEKFFIKNIGDSRVYLIRKNKKLKLTEDQSLVAQMIRNGQLTEEQARNHRQKNVLTMCLGIFEDIKTFSAEGKVCPGDVFLLCSDGFHNFVNEDSIIPIINSSAHKDFNQKAALLRKAIPPGNAKDNVSIILVRFAGKRNWMSSILTVVIILAAVAVIIGGIDLLKHSNYLNYIKDLAGSVWK